MSPTVNWLRVKEDFRDVDNPKGELAILEPRERREARAEENIE